MTLASVVVDLALRQAGDRYRFGAEVSADDPDPEVWDCSELIEWVCRRAGVEPRMPDGSWIQYRHCHQHDTDVAVATALDARGALLFRFGSDPLTGGRPRGSHVALSLGDGRTVEARSTVLGVGVWGNAGARKWTHAGLIPGVDYAATATLWPVVTFGDRGNPVGRVQGLLLAHHLGPAGLVDHRGYPDGIFGPLTRSHVLGFQRSRGLVGDGAVGPETWRALLGFDR